MNIPRQENERVVVSQRHQELRDGIKAVRGYVVLLILLVVATIGGIAGHSAMTKTEPTPWDIRAHVVDPSAIDVSGEYFNIRAKEGIDKAAKWLQQQKEDEGKDSNGDKGSEVK